MLPGFTPPKPMAGTGGVHAASFCFVTSWDAPGTCIEAQELKSSWFGQVRCGLLLFPCSFSRLSSSFMTAGSQNRAHTSGLHPTRGLKNSIDNSHFYWKSLTTYCTVCHIALVICSLTMTEALTSFPSSVPFNSWFIVGILISYS